MQASQPRRAFTEDSWQKASSFWTGLSASTGLLTCCAALVVAKAERNVLGRWAQNQSDTYVRLHRTLVQKLQLSVVSVILGRDDVSSV